MVKGDHGSQTDFELDLSLLNTNWHQIVGECLRILKPHQFLHLNNSDNKISFPAGLLGSETQLSLE